MSNDPPTFNGDHGTTDGRSYMRTQQNPTVQKPLAVAKKGSMASNGTKTQNGSSYDMYSDTYTPTISNDHENEVSYSKDQQVTLLQSAVTYTLGKFVSDFDAVDEHYVDEMSIDGFLDFIERQRLTYMPHRGSRWDKVLKWSEFFALQVSGYGKAVEAFIPQSSVAVKLIWAASHQLLELGPDNAKALETTFGIFYYLALSLSSLLRHNRLLHVNAHIRLEAAEAFKDLLELVREISLYYNALVNGMLSTEVNVNLTVLFGHRMEDFLSRKNHIIDSMWRNQLGEQVSLDIVALRDWLTPRDHALKQLHGDSLLTPEHRDQYTCEWFQRRLLDFTRGQDDVLALFGPEGCGKTYLSRWVVERLHRPIGKKSHETLFYAVESDVASSTTSLAVIKGLSLQLLGNIIGNKSYFDALVKAYNVSMSQGATAAKLEEALWKALDCGLDGFTGKGKDNLVIVVDGLDELKGEQDLKAVTHQLELLTSKHSRLQAITFSRTPPQKPSHSKTQSFEVKPDDILQDLRHVAEHALRGCSHYDSRNEHAREAIIEQLVHSAKGSFLWLLLIIRNLRRETSNDNFEKGIKTVKASPQTLHQLIGRVCENSDMSEPDTNHIVSWLLSAQRPLTLSELKCLLEIDLQRKNYSERKTDVQKDVQAALGPLVVFQNSFVRLRHSAIRRYLLDLQSRSVELLKPLDAHTDFTTRLLAYCQFKITQHQEPSLEPISWSKAKEVFAQHVLLEYAVRYWTSHFSSSSMQSKGSLHISKEFKEIFPGSTLLAMLEWVSWSPQAHTVESHELALRIRENVFTEKHECVLQSMITCGSFSQRLSKTTEAGTYFYRASRIGQAVLRKQHALTLTCATTFLNITESIMTNTRTELATRKEETLKYVIDIYKHQHGQSHDLVIRYYKMLAQLYVDIHEEEKAEVIWREVREIVVSRFGKGSEEETNISEKLTIILKKGDRKKTDVVEYESGIFDITRDLEIWDLRRIKLTLELALSYESRKEFSMAEELYISLWRRLTERCHHSHHSHGIEIHIHTIDVALEYVRFLRRCHRHEEACSILICVWTEYEEYDFESETLFLRLKTVGELMLAVRLFSVAVSVFKKCWNWFKYRGKVEYTAACEVLISQTVEEIITTTVTGTTSASSITDTTTMSSTTETVVVSVFESALTRKEVTSETISVCKSLISFYMKLERWSEAIEVTKRSLSLVWKFAISGAGTVALPQNFSDGATAIATDLAVSYHRSNQFHEAEELYIRVYRACQNSCHIEDARYARSLEALVKFYEDHHHWHRMIEIYQEVLTQYRKTLGASHKLTIRILYLLGSLCAEHGHGHSHEYYEEIISTLNHASTICHPDALDAMLVVCRTSYEAGHWHKLKTVCETLWKTWIGQHPGHEKITADSIEILYQRYRYVLEHHAICEYSSLRQLNIEYRQNCVRAFGKSTAVSIRASIELAQICMRSETYIHEAIAIYEEILTIVKATNTTTVTSTSTATSTISISMITKIKKSLTIAYVQVCSHSSVSSTTIERAVVMLHERFESLKVSSGWANNETLNCLRELVVLQLKLKKQESQATVLRILSETSIDIIKKEKRSKILHETAKVLSDTYVQCGLVEQGRAMVDDIRLQIVTGTSNGKSTLRIDQSIDKVSYVFLVTFEQIIRGQTISYSEIMASLLTETLLYETYYRYAKSGNDITVVLTHAARLRAFLLSQGRTAQREILDKESFTIFTKEWHSVVKTRDEITRTFFFGLLEELGKEHRDAQIGNAACASSVGTVKHLLSRGRSQEAYEVAICALHFINHQRAFHSLQNVPYGFKLSALMVRRGLGSGLKPDLSPKLLGEMLELSRQIIRETLKACKDSNIDFVRLRLHELNELAGLLGEQQNFADLEWLLDLLWSSREVQKKWHTTTIITIGQRFVQARYLNKDHRSRAIRLCEDICYNMRRVHGSLYPKTLELSTLLSELYTSMGHYREAQGVHESILRLVVEGDDDDDRTIDTISAESARKHIDLLKQSFLRLKGWDKSPSVYRDLVAGLTKLYKGEPQFKDIQGTDKWDLKEAPSETIGHFQAPKDWEFAAADDLNEAEKSVADGKGLRGPGMGVKRATSNWGIGEVMKALHGAAHPHHKRDLRSGDAGKPKTSGMEKGAADGEDEEGFESADEGVHANGIKA